MTDVQRKALNDLISLGFREKFAHDLIRSSDLPAPLTERVLQNIQLLGRYRPLNELGSKRSDLAQIGVFLKRPYQENAFMSEIPGKLGFSEEEAEKYNHDPLLWSQTHDLQRELGHLLIQLVQDQESANGILRGLYLSAYTLWDAETQREICEALIRINHDSDRMNQLLKESWYLLFSYYSDTVGAIHDLVGLFGEERALSFLWSQPMLVKQLNQKTCGVFCERNNTIKRLKEDFAMYLI